MKSDEGSKVVPASSKNNFNVRIPTNPHVA